MEKQIEMAHFNDMLKSLPASGKTTQLINRMRRQRKQIQARKSA